MTLSSSPDSQKTILPKIRFPSDWSVSRSRRRVVKATVVSLALENAAGSLDGFHCHPVIGAGLGHTSAAGRDFRASHRWTGLSSLGLPVESMIWQTVGEFLAIELSRQGLTVITALCSSEVENLTRLVSCRGNPSLLESGMVFAERKYQIQACQSGVCQFGWVVSKPENTTSLAILRCNGV